LGGGKKMSRFLTITNSTSTRIGSRKKALNSEKVKIGKITLNFILVILICMAGVIYIYEVNRLAVRGYEISSLEKQIQEIREENERIKIRAAEIKSMYKIEEEMKQINMSAPKNVTYIQLPGQMAINR